MGSGVIVLKNQDRSKILHEWKEVIIQEVNIVLSIENTLYNHKMCLDVAHATFQYHNTPAPEPIPFPDAALSEHIFHFCIETQGPCCQHGLRCTVINHLNTLCH